MDNVFHLRRRTIDYGSYRGGDTHGIKRRIFNESEANSSENIIIRAYNPELL